MRNALVCFLAATSFAGCSGGGGSAPAPAASVSPSAAFLPSTVTVRASAYDYFGTFAFTASSNGVPKPIAPADGSLACDGGVHVPLQIRSGPVALTTVHDQYVVEPLLASEPVGTTLTCTSEWGIYDANGTLLASSTLNATIVFDQTNVPGIFFSPATATVHAAGGDKPIDLEYTSASGFSVEPVTPADGSLACPGGYAPQTQLRAGPGAAGDIVDQFVVVTSSIAPPAGTSLACTATWGLYDATGTLVQEASLAVTLAY